MEIAQNSGSYAPNVTVGERDRIEMPHHSVPVPAVALMVDRLHQKRERHFEGLVHLRGIERQLEMRIDPSQRRNDAIAERRHVEIEIADRMHEPPIEPDLLAGFA